MSEWDEAIEAAASLFWPAGQPEPKVAGSGLTGFARELQRDLRAAWVRGTVIRSLKRGDRPPPADASAEVMRWADDGGP